MKPDIDKKFIHSFVLLERQFLITEYLVKKRKPRVLSEFEKSLKLEKQSVQDVLRVYELVFSIIDNVVRYEKIASTLPKFNQKNEDYKRFSKNLEGMKELRNLLQHINGEIENDFKSPILGGVAWVKNNTNYMAAFNDLGEGKSLPSLVYDTHKDEFTQDFCYVHDGKYYDLSKAIKGYQDYQKYVKNRSLIKVDAKSYDVSDHFVALGMEIAPHKSKKIVVKNNT